MSRWLWVAFGIVVATWAGSAIVHTGYGDRLPEQVPIHWNINMEPDGFVSRDRTFVIFYMMPTLMAAILALLAAVLPWMAPVRYKVDPFRPIYDYIIALVMGLFAYLHVMLLMAQVGGIAFDKWFLAGFFLFFGLLGNVLGKVRKNFWVGIRTPWTIASDVVWEKTHRLAAWLFVAMGILGFAMVMAGVPPMWCFGLLMVAAMTPVVYSLVIYKRLESAGKMKAAS